ncbi:unnamed protein product [Ectocarpus sp. 4 AP-2014]
MLSDLGCLSKSIGSSGCMVYGFTAVAFCRYHLQGKMETDTDGYVLDELSRTCLGVTTARAHKALLPYSAVSTALNSSNITPGIAPPGIAPGSTQAFFLVATQGGLTREKITTFVCGYDVMKEQYYYE